MNVAGAVRAVRAALEAAGTPARAVGAKAFLKSEEKARRALLGVR